MSRFLIVDDEPALTGVISRLLIATYPDAEVRTASSNVEALEILAHFRPSLITTDIYRPGGTGYELLDAVRLEPRTRYTPVIGISGGADELEQYRYGFDAVLKKPFSTKVFLGKVNRLLRLHSDPDVALIHLGIERQDLDYKALVDLGRKAEVAALAKDVIAMANYGGGNIVIGVHEPAPGRFIPEGLTEAEANSFETSRLNRAIRGYLDPKIHVASRRVEDGSKLFIILEVPSASRTPILAAMQHEGAGIYPGRVYSRTSGAESAEVRSAAELRDLLERLANSRSGA